MLSSALPSESMELQKSMFKSESDQSHYMIPLMLDLSTSRVLVIGTGAVGQRKAEYFAGHCKELVLSDTALENLSDFDIIIAATASAGENERICSAAASLNKLYNSATGIGNFLIPAAAFAENYTIAVSTNGKAPAVSAFLRDKIESDLPSFSRMIDLQETLRAELKNTVPEQKRRAEILRAVLEDDAVWKALDLGDFDAALSLARRIA